MATAKKRKTPQPKKRLSKLEVIKPVPEPRWRPIDFQKVKTINDVKTILEHMSLGCWDNAPAYELLAKYLKDDE